MIRSLCALLVWLFCNAPALSAECSDDGITISSDFPGGGMADCRFLASGTVLMTVQPESQSINPSPWYAFRMTSERPRTVVIHLDYGDFEHRYAPDYRIGDGPWALLPSAQLVIAPSQTVATLTLDLPAEQQLTVAAQPVLNSTSYTRWMQGLPPASVAMRAVGESLDGAPIWRLQTPSREQTLLILGRQHPPETTGADAMRVFIERLLADDALATAFRERVGLLVYPLINPDGVDAGHWRHNRGGVDLNRDWGIFSQPETRAVFTDIARFLNAEPTTLIKSLDFHSTHYEVFYTQEDNTAVVAPGLMPAWLTEFERQMQGSDPTFALNRQSSNNDRPTAKSFFNATFGIASTTFEMDDSSSPDFIERYANAAAESLMRVWLESD